MGEQDLVKPLRIVQVVIDRVRYIVVGETVTHVAVIFNRANFVDYKRDLLAVQERVWFPKADCATLITEEPYHV
jgi:hypothetical protein